MSGNGCGPESIKYVPQWLLDWVKKALFNWFHEASCDKHDEGYEEGGDEARRKVCDTKFFEAMRRDSLRYRGLQRALRYSQAHVFYTLVRLFGSSNFKYRIEP